jgi:hypothetical protein
MKAKKLIEDDILPSVKSTPSVDLIDFTWLIYGAVKIGKSTLFSCFPKCLHFMFEPGAEAVSLYKLPKDKPCFKNWEEAKKALSRLERKNHRSQFQFRMACFDTGEKAWKMCLKYMTDEILGAHPNEMKDYGASWVRVSQEFHDMHLRVKNMGLGFGVIAHETIKEFTDWKENTYDKVQPKFSKNVADFYEEIIDTIGYYHLVGRERMLQIRGDRSVVAGTRLDGRFLTPEGFEIWSDIQEIVQKPMTRRRKIKLKELSRLLRNHQIVKIPMGYTPQSSYSNLLAAYNNQQRNIFNDDELIIKKGGRIHDMK